MCEIKFLEVMFENYASIFSNNYECFLPCLIYSVKSIAYLPLSLVLVAMVFIPTLFFIFKKYEKFQRFAFFTNLLSLVSIFYVSINILIKEDFYHAWGSLILCTPFLLNLMFIAEKNLKKSFPELSKKIQFIS